jgi:hypothetical protein
MATMVSYGSTVRTTAAVGYYHTGLQHCNRAIARHSHPTVVSYVQ